ncbi:MAG: SufE family protein [Salinivirgaceae bacterium]|nr:SufE family protein [Salinivirgaceae bacterium]MDD4747394.1 SufE family protein [Salinivirgaceae bacterium]
MTNIEEIQQNIVAEFSDLDDWMDKYALLIDLGKELKPLDEELRIKQNLIDGCQSRVWVHANYEDGKIFFQGDSDAILTKGLISLIIRAYNGQSPDDILNNQPNFINEIGLAEHLSPTRSNGLNSMIKQIKLYAMAFKIKYKQ